MSTHEAYRRELEGLLDAFAGNVRRLREEKKPECSQEEVAMEANLHRTQWGMIEQGKRDPRFSTMLIVADTLGVTLDELAEGIDAPQERKPSPPTTKRKPPGRT